MWDVRKNKNRVFKRHHPSQSMCYPKCYIIMGNLSLLSIISAISGARLATLATALLCHHVPSSAHSLYYTQIGHRKVLNYMCDNGLVILVWEHKFCPLTEILFWDDLFLPSSPFSTDPPLQHVWEVRSSKESGSNSGRKEKNPVALTDFSSSPPLVAQEPHLCPSPTRPPLLTFLIQKERWTMRQIVAHRSLVPNLPYTRSEDVLISSHFQTYVYRHEMEKPASFHVSSMGWGVGRWVETFLDHKIMARVEVYLDWALVL